MDISIQAVQFRVETRIESDPGPWRFGDGFVLASSSGTAFELCESLHGDRVVGVARATTYSSIYRCHARSGRGGSGSAGGHGSDSGEACPSDVNLPLDGLRLHAFDGMNSGIQFRRLDNCGIGDPGRLRNGLSRCRGYLVKCRQRLLSLFPAKGDASCSFDAARLATYAGLSQLPPRRELDLLHHVHRRHHGVGRSG